MISKNYVAIFVFLVIPASVVTAIFWYKISRQDTTIHAPAFTSTMAAPGYVVLPGTADQFIMNSGAMDLGPAPVNTILTGVSLGFNPSSATSYQAINALKSWLTREGFTDITVFYSPRDVMTFSGTIDQLEDAFHIQIHQYRVNGVVCQANPTDVQIPEQFTSEVLGMPLNDCYHSQPV